MVKKYNRVMYNLVEDDGSAMDHKSFSSKGGRATLKKHGKEHMREIGRKGGKNRWVKVDPWDEKDNHLIQ